MPVFYITYLCCDADNIVVPNIYLIICLSQLNAGW